MTKLKNSVNLDSLDFLLKDILEQIKILEQERKDASYSKLIELFFKGIDLKEKIENTSVQECVLPEVNFIKGLDKDLI